MPGTRQFLLRRIVIVQRSSGPTCIATGRTAAIANSRHTVRYYPGRGLAYAVMKQLLLLTFVAFASEAMAQDAQCVPERAASGF